MTGLGNGVQYLLKQRRGDSAFVSPAPPENPQWQTRAGGVSKACLGHVDDANFCSLAAVDAVGHQSVVSFVV